MINLMKNIMKNADTVLPTTKIFLLTQLYISISFYITMCVKIFRWNNKKFITFSEHHGH